MEGPSIDYDRGWTHWGDMIRYSPAPFHRRRLALELAEEVAFGSVLDVGCGNGELLAALGARFPATQLVGADVSAHVIEEDRRRFPRMEFHTLDLGTRALDVTCDLVLCCEVVEHVADWEAALRHLRRMCRSRLILTVPSGPVYPIDRMVGHVRHFEAGELVAGLRRAGFEPERVWRWGFPFHTLYKRLINLRPEATMKDFASGGYGVGQKLVATLVRAAFYLNLRDAPQGRQLVVRAVAA